MSAKVTSAFIRSALRAYHQPGEWAAMFEVADQTGVGAARRADALFMNLWPSRGLELRGVEIKVARNDLLRELARPEKAERIAVYCDTWWIAAPKGLCMAADLPKAWGLLEVSEKGAVRIGKRAEARPKSEVREIDRKFLAACLRGAGKIDEAAIAARVQQLRDRDKEEYEKKVSREVDRRMKCAKEAEDLRAKIMEICGENPEAWFSHDRFVRAFRAVYQSRLADPYSGLEGIAATIEREAARLETMGRTIRDQISGPVGQEAPDGGAADRTGP